MIRFARWRDAELIRCWQFLFHFDTERSPCRQAADDFSS